MSELNNNQENQDWGGKREGAGRPKGTKNKLNVLDFFNEGELTELMNKTIELAKDDPNNHILFDTPVTELMSSIQSTPGTFTDPFVFLTKTSPNPTV